ncbi:MAG: mandelate racemase/muconate lactonizing enzyme family protein [Ilumatobacteraceae bacterium]
MRLASCETFVVGTPPPHLGGRYFLFVKLTTTAGVVGYGEVYAATFGPAVIEQAVHDVAERHLIGHEVSDIEAMWRRVYGSGYTLRPDPTLVGVLSGLEIACWDIVGKELDRPVYRLLGGRVHERLRGYTYLYPRAGDTTDVYTDPDLAATRAAEAVAAGFTAVKFDPAGPYTVYDGHQPSLDDLDRSEAMVAAVREAVGPQADILFGTHGQFSPSGAIRLARRIERYEPLWFEEPIPPGDPAAMATVARATSIPIATGERLTTVTEFGALIEHRAVGFVQPNLGRCGGILAAKKIAALAEAGGVHLAPHLYCGPVVGAANIQVSTCSPNFAVLEGIGDWGGFHAELLRTPVRFESGAVIPPEAPGIGVEVDEDVARAHPYHDGGTADDLHLRMHPDPVR